MIGARVLVRQIQKPTQTASGIILPDHSNAPRQRGEVICTGPKCVQAKCGMAVTWKYGTIPWFEEGDLLIFEESDLLMEIAEVYLQA